MCNVQAPQIDLPTTEDAETEAYSDRQAARHVFCELTYAAVYQSSSSSSSSSWWSNKCPLAGGRQRCDHLPVSPPRSPSAHRRYEDGDGGGGGPECIERHPEARRVHPVRQLSRCLFNCVRQPSDADAERRRCLLIHRAGHVVTCCHMLLHRVCQLFMQLALRLTPHTPNH